MQIRLGFQRKLVSRNIAIVGQCVLLINISTRWKLSVQIQPEDVFNVYLSSFLQNDLLVLSKITSLPQRHKLFVYTLQQNKGYGDIARNYIQKIENTVEDQISKLCYFEYNWISKKALQLIKQKLENLYCVNI